MGFNLATIMYFNYANNMYYNRLQIFDFTTWHERSNFYLKGFKTRSMKCIKFIYKKSIFFILNLK